MEESEDRKLRLKAMRREADEAEASPNINTSTVSAHLSNPLAEFANLPVQESSSVSARFDFYTDPMAAFSGNRRKCQKTYENSPNYVSPLLSSASPGSRNLDTTPSPSHQYSQSQRHSSDQGMYGTPLPHHTSGPRNISMTASPNHQYNQSQNHSSDQGMYGTPLPHHTSGPRNLNMTPPNHQYNQSQSHSSDQGMYGSPLPHHTSGSWRSPNGMFSPSPQQLGTPTFNGTPDSAFPPNSPTVGGYPPNNNFRGGFRPSPSSVSGRGYHNFGHGDSPSPNAGRGGNTQFNNSPNTGSGWGGSPSFNIGRGGGHQFRGSNPGRGSGRRGGRGSRGDPSARDRPDLFYHKSMLEDPWRYLQPVVIRLAVAEGSSSTPGSLDSWLPKSIRNKNKATESVTPVRSGSSFAAALAVSYEEAAALAASYEGAASTSDVNDV